ncbi:DUF2798 domain-containing protein [Novosphingobium sp. 9U]|uniref:DUF2798 domain-containing protein n=1 Tax=Novosphingobium sp. 9U TaxID=2653158 RepID=UPI0012EFF011|nr:DUF2798 domain-containing protein [Novosphingobium sp. 9U]VWX51156.1 conserved hypothetical protein [Novosphingobium sp. 9U]
MQVQLKRKIAFALLMGVITTGLISFAVLALNLGFSDRFLSAWLRSWGFAYVIAIPAILLLAPPLQAKIDQLIN